MLKLNRKRPVLFRFIVLACVYLLVGVLPANAVDVKEQQRVLKVGVSFSIPPWVIRDSNSGIELDILREALESEGFSIKPVYVPFSRAYELFDQAQLDIVINAKRQMTGTGYLSEPVVRFQNVAISLASKGFPEQFDLSFMGDKSVVAFQKASQLLGNGFGNVMRSNPYYEEVARQYLQLNLLFIREVDFIVMDKSIFGYFWNDAMKMSLNKPSYSKEIRFHSVFPPSAYSFLFHNEGLRDVFDDALDRMKMDGSYKAIFERYRPLINMYDTSKSIELRADK